MTAFQQAIIKAVAAVPSGHVVSYGQVAAYIGAPRAARQVGWAMGSIGEAPDFPWWRVVNREGVITINNQHVTPQMQRDLLLAEGVVANEGLRVDLAQYQYDLQANGPGLTDDELQQLRHTADKFFDS